MSQFFFRAFLSKFSSLIDTAALLPAVHVLYNLNSAVVLSVSFLWRYNPNRTYGASVSRFIDHTHAHTHTGRTPLDE
jgi:hypothetical protein